VRFDDHKLTRSNSPSELGPMSTLTTDRINKNIMDDKTTTISGGRSEDKFTAKLTKYHNFGSLHIASKSKGEGHNFNKKKSLKKVSKKRSKRDGSTVSSNSSQPITSYRTAPVVKSMLNTPKVADRESELHKRITNLEIELEYYKNKEIPKFNISENKLRDMFDTNHEEIEEPISFRDNMIEENEENLKLECDSDFDYEQFEDKLESKNQLNNTVAKQTPNKVKIKKLSKCHDKEAIIKLFDQIESELLYSSNLKIPKHTVYLEDSAQRIWEITKNDDIKITYSNTFSTLKSIDSPMSMCSDNLRLSTEGKNKTAVHDLKKLSIDSDEDKVTNISSSLILRFIVCRL
jgi:hypothetical protein